MINVLKFALFTTASLSSYVTNRRSFNFYDDFKSLMDFKRSYFNI